MISFGHGANAFEKKLIQPCDEGLAGLNQSQKDILAPPPRFRKAKST